MNRLAVMLESGRSRAILIVVAIAAASVFPFLAAPDLWDFDEAFYAEISRNMAVSGDFIAPTYNGRISFDKPPLLYWLTAAWYRVFGIDESGIRVPSALFLVATCAITYLIGERLFSVRVGILAGVILGTSLFTVIIGRMGLMDTGLMFFVTAAVYLLLTSENDGRLARYVLAGTLIGFGILIKGPIAAFLAVLATFCAMTPRRFFERLRRPGLWATAAVGLAVATPWHIAMIRRYGSEFYSRYLGFHQVSLLTSEMLGHGGPFYYYLVVLAFGLLPWSAILIDLPMTLKSLATSKEKRASVMCLLWWSAPMLVFFSVIATKAPAYVLPVLPPLCVLLSAAWIGRDRTVTPTAVTCVISLIGLVALLVLRGIIPPQYADKFWLLVAPLAAVVVVTAIGLAASIRSRGSGVHLRTAMLCAIVLVTAFGYIVMPALDSLKPNKPLGEWARANLESDVQIGSLLQSGYDASTVFYARRPITMLFSAEEAARFLSEPGKHCALVWDHDIAAVESLVDGELERLASIRRASAITLKDDMAAANR